jgi:glycosyltransferase involved in cell wall biosynthesis
MATLLTDKIDLSIVIPAYNEQYRIGKTLDDYLAFFDTKLKGKYEILVVLNGCKDKTLEIILDYKKHHPNLNYLDIKEAIGKGGALTEGFKIATGKIVGFTDADGSTSPKMFLKLYDILSNLPQIDCIIGSRNLPQSVVLGRTSSRKIMTAGFNFGVNFMFNLNIKDTQCGAKLVRKLMIKKIVNNLSIANMAFDVNLLVDIKRNGGQTLEIPITWEDTEDSSINNPIKTSLAMALSVVRLRLIYSPFKFLYPILNTISRPFYKLLIGNDQNRNYQDFKQHQS